jgi:HSP20 family protein
MTSRSEKDRDVNRTQREREVATSGAMTEKDKATKRADRSARGISTDERPTALVVRAELPGLTRDDINIEVDEGTLRLWGESRQEKREEREGFIRTERSYGAFYRAIPLPDGADEDHISAEFRDGVLEVTVPLSDTERGRRIEIR